MDIQLRLVELIKTREALNEKAAYRKANAKEIVEQIELTLELEKGISYVKGLKDALSIIQNQQ